MVTIDELGKNVYAVTEETMPSYFLKFAQYRLSELQQNISHDIKNTIVSEKKNLNLLQYWNIHVKTHLGKDLDESKYSEWKWNTSSLESIYKYVDVLEKELKKLIDEGNSASMQSEENVKMTENDAEHKVKNGIQHYIKLFVK